MENLQVRSLLAVRSPVRIVLAIAREPHLDGDEESNGAS